MWTRLMCQIQQILLNTFTDHTSQTCTPHRVNPTLWVWSYRHKQPGNAISPMFNFLLGVKSIRSLITNTRHFSLHLSLWCIQNWSEKQPQWIQTKIAFHGELQWRVMQISERIDFTPNKTKEVSHQKWNKHFIICISHATTYIKFSVYWYWNLHHFYYQCLHFHQYTGTPSTGWFICELAFVTTFVT